MTSLAFSPFIQSKKHLYSDLGRPGLWSPRFPCLNLKANRFVSAMRKGKIWKSSKNGVKHFFMIIRHY